MEVNGIKMTLRMWKQEFSMFLLKIVEGLNSKWSLADFVEKLLWVGNYLHKLCRAYHFIVDYNNTMKSMN